MKPKLTYFYHKGCHNCKALTPLINEISTPLNIKVINTSSDDVLLDVNLIKFVPTLGVFIGMFFGAASLLLLCKLFDTCPLFFSPV